MPDSITDPRAHVAAQLEEQAEACAAMGSPLYASLLGHAATDVHAAGPCWDVLRDHVLPGRGDALALRFMAAVHRLVLAGDAPTLAALYAESRAPEVCVQRNAAVWPAFVETVATHRETLARDVAVPCQTNEVGRSAGLMFGFLDLAATTGRPLRLLEVGASAGLNLRFDHFRYGGGGACWGDAGSPVDLTGLWAEAPPHVDAPLAVASRQGCDPNPIDVTTPRGLGAEELRSRRSPHGTDAGFTPASEPDARRALLASVWADQGPRFHRLEGALALAAQVPATVVRASADAFVAEQLAASTPGVTTVVYHSVVQEYFDAGTALRFRAALEAAGARATAEAPVAWLRLEPVSALRHHGVTLTTWPGGDERLLAVCGAHGQGARPQR
ncbi:MAG: DUF2332 domain-containing protein [Vicinamibacteria bacterium]|jgi:hypothetical protein|nr:DUF2332 domain-containing protein [Vicinamibacteria bacterium]